jgi:hypothetical protein
VVPVVVNLSYLIDQPLHDVCWWGMRIPYNYPQKLQFLNKQTKPHTVVTQAIETFKTTQITHSSPHSQPSNTTTMSGNSNVGNSQVYEAGDQRNAPKSEQAQADRFHEGNTHAHSATDSSLSTASLVLRCCFVEDN